MTLMERFMSGHQTERIWQSDLVVRYPDLFNIGQHGGPYTPGYPECGLDGRISWSAPAPGSRRRLPPTEAARSVLCRSAGGRHDRQHGPAFVPANVANGLSP
jgi:hypothetical protein